MELTEEEKTKARFEMLNARISELEKENKHYLEVIAEKDKLIKQINNLLYSDGADGEICAKIMELI